MTMTPERDIEEIRRAINRIDGSLADIAKALAGIWMVIDQSTGAEEIAGRRVRFIRTIDIGRE